MSNLKILRDFKNSLFHFIDTFRVNKLGGSSLLGLGTYIINGKNIDVGYNSFIGRKSTLVAKNAKIKIGNNVMTGPEIMIFTGNHDITVIGELMIKVSDNFKKKSCDMDVLIESDVWIGARAIILKGTKISTGSVIAAGAIVNIDVPPYTIFISKDKQIPRFSTKDLEIHKKIINEKYGSKL
jgi:maltose O-acetyltransferase